MSLSPRQTEKSLKREDQAHRIEDREKEWERERRQLMQRIADLENEKQLADRSNPLWIILKSAREKRRENGMFASQAPPTIVDGRWVLCLHANLYPSLTLYSSPSSNHIDSRIQNESSGV
jgi:hypothetical protein